MLRNAPYICIHIYKYIYYIYIKNKKSFENSVDSCLLSGKRPWGCQARFCLGHEERRRVTARDQPAPAGALATRGEAFHSTKRVARSGAKPLPAAPPAPRRGWQHRISVGRGRGHTAALLPLPTAWYVRRNHFTPGSEPSSPAPNCLFSSAKDKWTT